MKPQDDNERLAINVSSDRGNVIRVDGELDFYNRGKLMLVIDSFFTQGQSSFVLDLSNVSYIDSSGLSSLVLVKRLVENRKGMMPCVFSNSVKKIISLSGLEKFFKSYPNIKEAKKAFTSTTS